VVLTSHVEQINTLGVTSYVEFNPTASGVPAGKNKLIYIKSVNPVPLADINAGAAAQPGSIWYVLGEPNASGALAADLVVGLHDTYAAIRAADPTAKITSPSLLNFDFTCIACGGYPSGRSWADSFRKEYSAIYGVEPPVDYWAIDTYPIIWDTDQFPTTVSTFIKSDIEALRVYLNAIPGQAGKPIIITEIGLHWGFDGVTFSEPGCGWYPSGTYQTQAVKDYLSDMYLWFEQNSSSLNLSQIFTFSTFRDLTLCHADSGYGLTLFDSAAPGGKLTDIGQFFYDWIRNIRN
jgi:hypothetical protein